jgi:hypothetical protein
MYLMLLKKIFQLALESHQRQNATSVLQAQKCGIRGWEDAVRLGMPLRTEALAQGLDNGFDSAKADLRIGPTKLKDVHEVGAKK